MVFDGRELTSFDSQLLSDLHVQSIGAPASIDPIDPDGPGRHGRRGSGRSHDRRVGVVVMGAFVALVLVGAGLGIASRRPGDSGQKLADIGRGRAMTMVASALDQTIAANHFDFDYRIAETPATHPTPTTAPDCHMLGGGSVIFKPADGQAVTSSDTTGVPTTGQATPDAHPTCYAATVPHDITVTGQGTVNVAPKALTASADISSGMKVDLVLLGDQIQYSGSSISGPPQSLSSFAGSVDGELGPRAGALAMTQMASPAGYLDLEKEAVTGATAAGTGTVDGVPVTNFDVTVDPSRLLQVPGLTPDEQKTIQSALDLLHKEGFTGVTVQVGIDGAGFIRQVHSTDHFADGGKVDYDATYRNFGCAPTVTAPGAAPTPAPTTSVPCDAPPGLPVSPTTGAPASPSEPQATTTTAAPSTTAGPTTTAAPAGSAGSSTTAGSPTTTGTTR